MSVRGAWGFESRSGFRKRKGPRTKPNHGPKATQAAIGTRYPIAEPTTAPKSRAYHDKGTTARSMKNASFVLKVYHD